MTSVPAPITLFEAMRVLQRLDARGTVSLPGRSADVTLRWLGLRRAWLSFAVGVLVVGVVLIVVGGVLRGAGVTWALAVPVGALLAFCGAIWVGTVILMRLAMRSRVAAEAHPVMIDPRGVTLRGIGPIPWGWVAPPERRRVRVRNDIGGDCTVMPLTPEGRVAVNAQPGWWRHLVGPKPYLRVETPFLLLPGIEGFTEEETLQLFAAAHERFAR